MAERVVKIQGARFSLPFSARSGWDDSRLGAWFPLFGWPAPAEPRAMHARRPCRLLPTLLCPLFKAALVGKETASFSWWENQADSYSLMYTAHLSLLCLDYVISSSIPNNWPSRVFYTVRTYCNVSTEDFKSFPTLTKPSQYLRHGYTPGTSARLCYIHSSVNKSQCELFREQRREEPQILPQRGQETLQSTTCKWWRKKDAELGSSL